MPNDRVNGWMVTLIIGAIAFVIRFVNIGYPNKLVFDETYYAKDAYSLVKFGYERNWPSDANSKIIAGNVDVMQQTAAFVVHPQLGKWLIAVGEYLFGMNSFGWRFASLVFGTLLIMVTIRLVRRVSKSTLIGGLAGILLTFDGLEFVMSRTALLDIFLAFFVVAGVACLVADREWFRNRLARYLELREIADLGGEFGPALRSAASGTRCTHSPRLHCFHWRGTWERAAWRVPEDGRSRRFCAMAFPPSFPWWCSAWWCMSARGPAGC
jgi:dolichyl-phosphate-mannose-protein mannosyltransferase